ncbi:hypothetical protein L873DRAFT_1794342 [Choiromyces venosus 120613-1]|uniref:Uncharacterized protein n=1 Tax=Choiromyces venosus 120613-1 TaxID=1336337 RepID=A0A3N4J4T8_9PEZI|nr:hypothetical protein L873DRAFT_1794342 [Choiromyces venosus 120613-1]
MIPSTSRLTTSQGFLPSYNLQSLPVTSPTPGPSEDPFGPVLTEAIISNHDTKQAIYTATIRNVTPVTLKEFVENYFNFYKAPAFRLPKLFQFLAKKTKTLTKEEVLLAKTLFQDKIFSAAKPAHQDNMTIFAAKWRLVTEHLVAVNITAARWWLQVHDQLVKLHDKSHSDPHL